MLKQSFLYKKLEEYKSKKFKQHQEALELSLIPVRKAFYSQFIRPNSLVFDVGANVGNRVQVFLELTNKVIAVEPQPSCADVLMAKFGEKIIIEQVGLSDKQGELEMRIASDSTISSFSNNFIEATSKGRFKNYSWNETITVPVTTLDQLIHKHGIPAFCKIDVEGFELNVLQGLTKPIPYISFEYCVPELQDNMINCINYLATLSPTATFNYATEENMQLANEVWINHSDFLQLVKSQTFINTQFGDIYFKN
jgi:FkbM family methyltransferase